MDKIIDVRGGSREKSDYSKLITGTEFLGGSGGIPRKILKSRTSETDNCQFAAI